MTDKLSQEQRSRLMANVKQKDTAPEMAVRRHLHRAGLRFRLHRRDLPGKPDLTFPGIRTVVFVHGCFWHQHGKCSKIIQPRSREGYWKPKLAATVERDRRNADKLKALGWSVIVVWECEASDARKLRELARTIRGRYEGKS